MIQTKIAELRKAKGISQEQLAELLNTTRQAVSKWERGESYPDIDRIKDLAVFFNVSIDYLLGHDIESVSLQRFLERLQTAVDNNTPDIGVDEIKLVVSAHPNSFHLLSRVVAYLFILWTKNHEDETVDQIIEYCRKALVLFVPGNPEGITLNDIYRTLAIAYSMKEDYASARKTLKDNKVYGADEFLADCELELGHDEEASALSSDMFLRAIGLIVNGQLTQTRLLLRQNRILEALELADWCISFVHSIGKNEDLLLDAVFIFTFTKAACQRHLGHDYSASMNFLLENEERLRRSASDTASIKYYYNERSRLVSVLKDMKETLYQKAVAPSKKSEIYPDALAIYEALYGGESNG